MQQELMKKTAVYTLIFFFLAMGLIFCMSADKEKAAGEPLENETGDMGASGRKQTLNGKETEGETEAAKEREQQKTSSEERTGRYLAFQAGEQDTSYLRIPIPEGCQAENITIENFYIDKKLRVLIPGAEEDFYLKNTLSGSREAIREGTFDAGADGAVLNFGLTGVYECRTILENENLYIRFMTPREMYDKIVVIDAACGGTDKGYTSGNLMEKDITLQIAGKLKEKLDESDVRAYYTRMGNVNLSEESRISFGNEIKADMYIRIEVSAFEDDSVYGIETAYNGDYFIPGFGSLELADYLEREVTTAVKSKAIGLVEAQPEDTVLKEATIPAAAVRAGCLTNAQEAILLGREEYLEKAAEGIYNAIMKIYDENME